MANHEFKRGLEAVRELAALRQSEANGRKQFHNSEASRLSSGRKRDEHVVDSHVADRLAGAYQEIIERIDIELVVRKTERLALPVEPQPATPETKEESPNE